MIAPHRSSSSGFTLLETLVSLALTAIMITMLAGVVKQYGLTWQAGLSRLDEMEEEVLAQRLVSRDFESAVTIMPPDREGAYSFDGTADRLRLLSLAPSLSSPVPFHVINYQLDIKDGFIRSIIPYEGGLPLSSLSAGRGEVILSAKYQARLSYRDQTGHIVAEWHDGSLPQAVIVTLINTATRKEFLWENALTPRSLRACAPLSSLKACGDFIRAKLREIAQ